MNKTNQDSWFPRCRLAWIERRAKAQGHIGRNELMATFGISPAQASGDLQAYLSLNPNALIYQTSRKRYEWQTGAEFVISETPWKDLFDVADLAPDSNAASTALLSAADEFDLMVKEYDAWWMARSRVSISMQTTRDEYVDLCKWAAKELRTRAGKIS